MNEFQSFESGVNDAISDFSMGARPCVGPTETGSVTLNYIVSEFRSRLGCSDEYLAGYLSVAFNPNYQ